MSQRNLLLLFAALITSYACYVRAEQNPYARYVAAGFSAIDRYALQKPTDQELFNAAMDGMMAVLHRSGDEHSEFVDARQAAAFREDYDQHFGGVGLQMRILGEPPLPTVIGLPEEGTPAYDANIRLGDRIEAVDGQATAGLDLDQVVNLVRGPVGREVTMTMRRRGADQPHIVTVTRGEIAVESIVGDSRDPEGRWNFIIRDNPRIGYVRIIKFGDKTASELERILAMLIKQNVEGLVLDVRDDAGGVLDGAVAIADLFLRAGLDIVTTRDRDGAIRHRDQSTDAGDYIDLPLVVLADGQSASASEIVAAALKDHGRAKIVGSRTFGKGTVQQIMRIESGRSLLKLTTATFWRPSGKNIHRMPGDGPDAEWGVSPDPGLEVDLDERQYELWREFRLRRDLISEGMDPELVESLIRGRLDVPADYVDAALERAVEVLEDELPE
jgi:carboxyl-terminal processing protease